VTHLICRHHGRPHWCHLCLHSWVDGTKDDGCGDGQGCHTNIHSQEEVGHHEPIGVEQQKQKIKNKNKNKNKTKTKTKTQTKTETKTKTKTKT
jgi:hypothetical protein